jgi:hypothetical protein
VQVAALAPQATVRLLAVFLNMAELLAVLALCKPILSFIGLYLECGGAKAWQSQNLLEFCRPRQCYVELIPREVTDGWLSSA